MPNRRDFLLTTAAAGVGYWVAGGAQAKESRSPNERIAFASVGIEGKGQSDSDDANRSGDMVAICDVDDRKLGAAGDRRFKKAKKFNDYRQMLDEMGKSIDAVTVSTPDHCHALVAAMALKMKKHCFVQKPLTRSIHEARVLGQLARENGVATQMGNQGTANGGLRKAAAVVQAGALGTVKEVHVWTNRPVWPQGGNRPPAAKPPENLHWDLWLGPAPERPYANGAYHPFSWRGWWDFGCGALGDMACHTFNMPFAALNLRDPISVQAETSGHNKDSYPKWSSIAYEFPAIEKRPAVKVFWYDGGKRPPVGLFQGRNPGGAGALLVGEKDSIFSPGDYCDHFEFISKKPVPDVPFVKSPGHFQEWVRAIKGGEPAMSNFPDYAGPLTETILLGNLAVWAAASGKGEKVEWDPKELKVKNLTGLEEIVRPVYRKGYSL
ncbi:MAG: Gfo/Idh/MocA family oxidoreductase [Planctomycetota bacterium]